MSDIPRARELLNLALDRAELQTPYYLGTTFGLIRVALTLLDRKKPAFRAPRKIRKLSQYNVDYARHLRATGMSVNDIAVKLKTNSGRISEACS